MLLTQLFLGVLPDHRYLMLIIIVLFGCISGVLPDGTLQLCDGLLQRLVAAFQRVDLGSQLSIALGQNLDLCVSLLEDDAVLLVDILNELIVSVLPLSCILTIVLFQPDDSLLIVSLLLQHSLLLKFALIDALLGLILGRLNNVLSTFIRFDLALIIFHNFDHIVNILFQHIVILTQRSVLLFQSLGSTLRYVELALELSLLCRQIFNLLAIDVRLLILSDGNCFELGTEFVQPLL